MSVFWMQLYRDGYENDGVYVSVGFKLTFAYAISFWLSLSSHERNFTIHKIQIINCWIEGKYWRTLKPLSRFYTQMCMCVTWIQLKIYASFSSGRSLYWFWFFSHYEKILHYIHIIWMARVSERPEIFFCCCLREKKITYAMSRLGIILFCISNRFKGFWNVFIFHRKGQIM